MKKMILLMACAMLAMLPTTMQAQEQKKTERARLKAEAQAEESIAYAQAVDALKQNSFVLEADQVIFKNGETAFVNSNTNFILVDADHGTVQVAFNVPVAGPNGIGGVTVDGKVSGVKMKTSKKGAVSYNFSVMGSNISAQVWLNMGAGANQATVSINPNFNSRTLTLRGKVIPLEDSQIFKGRAL